MYFKRGDNFLMAYSVIGKVDTRKKIPQQYF